MDRRPTLETRPPVLIDAVVRALIPPACREHVIGDLWERYRSPRQFVLDAVRTIPFVVASQIRRTSTLAGIVIHTFILFVSLGTGARRLWPAVIAVAGSLLGFVLRDPSMVHSLRQKVGRGKPQVDAEPGLYAIGDWATIASTPEQ